MTTPLTKVQLEVLDSFAQVEAGAFDVCEVRYSKTVLISRNTLRSLESSEDKLKNLRAKLRGGLSLVVKRAFDSDNLINAAFGKSSGKRQLSSTEKKLLNVAYEDVLRRLRDELQ